MNTITIITIVVVALLTVLIFGLSWLAYASCIKAYAIEVKMGKHDHEIYEEYRKKKKSNKGLIGLIGSYCLFTILIGFFITGLVYKINGGTLSFNNETILVIKTGSMSDFYDEKTAEEYNYDTSLQFDVGDICVFDTNFNLVEGEVYGYKYKDIIIIHRLIAIDEEQGLYKFKGDNNNASDGYIAFEDIIYHYTGRKVPGIGAFVLYAQSYFGIWSIIGVIGVIISSEVVYYKINKINRERDKLLGGTVYEK